MALRAGEQRFDHLAVDQWDLALFVIHLHQGDQPFGQVTGIPIRGKTNHNYALNDRRIQRR